MIVDTHILLWVLTEPERVDQRRVRLIEDPTNVVFVSAISIAEVAIKSSIGKIVIDIDLLSAVKEAGFELLDFTATEAMALKDLPFHHKEPFDRMLIAQSRETGFPIITDDPKFSFYECAVL